MRLDSDGQSGRPVADRTGRTGIRDAVLSLGASALAAILVFVAGHNLVFVQIAERWLWDLRVVTFAASEPPSSDLVIIAITEETIADLPYRSPVDRRFLSHLLQEIAAKGPRLIAVDLLFDQPTEPDKDAELRATLAHLGVPAVVASASEEGGLTARQGNFLRNYLDGTVQGDVSLAADPIDKTVRMLFLGRRHSDQWVPSFAAAVARAMGRNPPQGERAILAYRGAPPDGGTPFPVFPAHAVAMLPREWLANRVVLVGADIALTDRHRTPFSIGQAGADSTMPGLLIHAHAVQQLLDGKAIHGAGVWQEFGAVILCAVVGWMVALSHRPARIVLLIAAAVLAGLWAVVFLIYAQSAYLVSIVVPSGAYLSAFAAATALLRYGEWEQKRFLREAFARYLPPQVINRLVINHDLLRLGGERRTLSCVTTDIAGFTALTETMEPTRMVELINAYLDAACKVVFEHHGTLDKMVGDALHVIFNAPLDQPDHPEKAVRCALALDACCQAFALDRRLEGIEFGLTRIGVNTGQAVIGNFGGHTRFDYTAYGDAINTTARLESANKQFGTRICVATATRDLCPTLSFRPIGNVVLKGKTIPIMLYESVTAADASAAKAAEYQEAYTLMECGEDKTLEARQAFERLTSQYPDDGLIAFHAERLRRGASGTLVVLAEK